MARACRVSNRYIESARSISIDSGIMFMFGHMTSERGAVDAMVCLGLNKSSDTGPINPS